MYVKKIQTFSVPGSEKYVRTKNNRLLLKSKCASCGYSKARFVSEKKGRGVGQTSTKRLVKRYRDFNKIKIWLLH